VHRRLDLICLANPPVLVTSVSDPSQATLPRRGEKDFEPNPTILQSDILATARNAMHNAISHPRLGSLRNRIVGIYSPEGPTPLVTAINQDAPAAVAEDNAGAEAPVKPKRVIKDLMSGIPLDACVYVPNSKGPYFKSVGKTDRWNRTWLLPEEALYLLERGTLDIRWPASITGPVQTEDDGEEMDIPMSLQAAYACFMGRGGLTSERYSVYTGLKRLGYIVTRAPAWDGSQDEPEPELEPENRIASYVKGISGCWSRFYNSIPNIWESDYSAQGPLIGFRTPRDYSECIKRELYNIYIYIYIYIHILTKTHRCRFPQASLDSRRRCGRGKAF
jgi:tRNA-splicing endonuclease subunit Sen54